MRITLFAIGSPLVADFEESCHRSNWDIVAGIRNRPGQVWTSIAIPVRDVADWDGSDASVLLALFTPANRQQAWQEARAKGVAGFPALVDPTAILPRTIAVAEGVYVNAGCVLGAASILGRFALVNRGASLGHHLRLGEFASIGPGVTIAGGVTVGARAMIGAGAVILPDVTIGEDAVVGAGCVVRHDVPPGVRFMGHS